MSLVYSINYRIYRVFSAHSRMLLLLTFFFFQAEDGIRDHCVTGVQTCALPISLQFDLDRFRPPRNEHRKPGAYAPFGLGDHTCLGAGIAEVQLMTTMATLLRSEERRVGKECRSRWSPYH